MDLLILAIGIVLGGACVLVLVRVREIGKQVKGSYELSMSTLSSVNAGRDALTKAEDKLETHDREIATLYANHNMKRD